MCDRLQLRDDDSQSSENEEEEKSGAEDDTLPDVFMRKGKGVVHLTSTTPNDVLSCSYG